MNFVQNSKVNTVFIPVGDSDFQWIITLATFLVIIGGTVFLSFTFINANAQISMRQHKE